MSKIAVVTGGTSAIGKETALYLPKNGSTLKDQTRPPCTWRTTAARCMS